MEIKGWQYYNHSAIPICAPHEIPDLTPVNNGDIWKIGKKDRKPLLVRYTTDWDCGYDTGFWYIIKDSPFDINLLKAKRRYEINKGNKNFEVKIIDPTIYKDELYRVQISAFSAYPEKYRPDISYKGFINNIDTWHRYTIFGAFLKETNELCGYSLVSKSTEYIDFCVQKTIPEYETFGVNASLVFAILEYYKECISNGCYICDGSRNINHETRFQDYLEKYFQFRKAYCKLHIKYKKGFGLFIKMIYPFRKLFLKFDNSKKAHQINALLKMEEIVRKQKKQ